MNQNSSKFACSRFFFAFSEFLQLLWLTGSPPLDLRCRAKRFVFPRNEECRPLASSLGCWVVGKMLRNGLGRHDPGRARGGGGSGPRPRGRRPPHRPPPPSRPPPRGGCSASSSPPTLGGGWRRVCRPKTRVGSSPPDGVVRTGGRRGGSLRED